MAEHSKWLTWVISLVLTWNYASAARGEDAAFHCQTPPTPTPDLARSEVYAGMPFQPGEEAKYELYYGVVRALVGYGFFRVGVPEKHALAVTEKDGKRIEERRWHRIFQAEAFTGDWYRMIFAGHDKLRAVSRPWDYGITKFYIKQDHEKAFSPRDKVEKWLDFNHVSCKVHERIKEEKKEKEETKDLNFAAGGVDALGALYRLRTFDFKKEKLVKIPVYTSEKNWWLEAEVEGFETVSSRAGIYPTARLKLTTYLGKDLQQKGKLILWIATDTPERPIVKIEGEVAFGSVFMILDQFTPGKS